MQKSAKKIWRWNFSMTNCDLKTMIPCMLDVFLYQDKTVGHKSIKKIVHIQNGYEIFGTYFLIDEIRDLIDRTIKTILTNPDHIQNIHKQAEQLNTKYFNFSKSLERIDLSKLSNRELLKDYRKIIDLQKKSHGWALPTTWFVDSDGEDFSNYLLNLIKKLIAKKKSTLKTVEVFSIITTPEKLSFQMKEEIESLKIVQEIKKDINAKKIFSQNQLDNLEKNLSKLDKKLLAKIKRHYTKWNWTPYTYIGPAYDMQYYLQVWSGLIKQNIDIDFELHKLQNHIKETKQEKQKILKELEINNKTKQLFDIAAEIIYLKAYRKDCFFYGMLHTDRILKEVGKRFNLSLKQARFLSPLEVENLLQGGEVLVNELNQRFKHNVYYQDGDKFKIYTGQKAKTFLATLIFEKQKKVKSNNLKGTTAHPGIVKGIVRIINTPDQMSKISQGEVMVAHTTFPSLVPAMKKAAAIVTDDGGITCHAAIVARELKTPCVVGTKVATKDLKDGDRVEVDADNGIVKIIKNKK